MNVDRLKKLVGSDINKYTITKYIGSGSFGDVFEGRDNKTNQLVALKIPVKTEERDGQKAVLDEARVYKYLSCPEKGVCNIKVTTNKDRKIIVMDLLGPSLEAVFAKSDKMNIKEITLIAVKMLRVIKHIHSCGFIHRDIKPDNFATGLEDSKFLYLIDFGLAKRFLKKSGEHIPFTERGKFCGTARYASIAAHKNWEQGRKDDLEALGYIFIYLFNGKLPWQGVKHKDKKERYRLIGEKKESLSEETLCEGMPKEFYVYLKYVRSMDFDERPHYTALINMFQKLHDVLEKI